MLRTVASLLILSVFPLAADPGTVERRLVRGRSLEGNLVGDSPDRMVSFYLPPSYHAETNRRFPVLYMLHGFTDSEARWMGHEPHWINLPEVIDEALAAQVAKEMIVVMPDAHNSFFGSMYSKSVTIGDWETFVAEELVAYTDSHYRTLSDPASRGLAGHSMGGYGAMRIGMKRPDVFSSVYLLSPCCLAPGRGRPRGGRGVPPIETFDDLAEASFGVKALYAGLAAWAPDPTNPPFFIDLPEDGEPDPMILAKLAANAPLAQLDQYVGNLKQLTGFAFDAGDEDAGIAAAITELDRALEKYAVERRFEIYPGDHTNRIGDRIVNKVLPFFSELLLFEQTPD